MLHMLDVLGLFIVFLCNETCSINKAALRFLNQNNNQIQFRDITK